MKSEKELTNSQTVVVLKNNKIHTTGTINKIDNKRVLVKIIENGQKKFFPFPINGQPIQLAGVSYSLFVPLSSASLNLR